MAEELYKVEKILNKAFRNGVTYYLIKWQDYDMSHNSWEPFCNLVNCNEKLREFEM